MTTCHEGAPVGGSDFHDIRKRGLIVTAGVLGAEGLKRFAPDRV